MNFIWFDQSATTTQTVRNCNSAQTKVSMTIIYMLSMVYKVDIFLLTPKRQVLHFTFYIGIIISVLYLRLRVYWQILILIQRRNQYLSLGTFKCILNNMLILFYKQRRLVHFMNSICYILWTKTLVHFYEQSYGTKVSSFSMFNYYFLIICNHNEFKFTLQ